MSPSNAAWRRFETLSGEIFCFLQDGQQPGDELRHLSQVDEAGRAIEKFGHGVLLSEHFKRGMRAVIATSSLESGKPEGVIEVVPATEPVSAKPPIFKPV